MMVSRLNARGEVAVCLGPHKCVDRDRYWRVFLLWLLFAGDGGTPSGFGVGRVGDDVHRFAVRVWRRCLCLALAQDAYCLARAIRICAS